MGQGPVHRAAGKQTDDLVIADDRESLVTIAGHPLGGFLHRKVGFHNLGPRRIDLRHLERWGDCRGQGGDQFRVRLGQGFAADQGRRRAIVSAAAETVGDLSHIHAIRSGTGDHLNVRTKVHQEEKPVRVEQVAQFVGEGGDLLHAGRGGSLRDEDALTVDVERFDFFHQPVVQPALFFGKRVVEEVRGERQAGALFQQPGGRSEVARGGSRIGKRPGVFVNSKQEQGGLHRLNGLRTFLQGFHQKRGGCAQRFQDGRPSFAQRPVKRVVVEHADLCMRIDAPNGRDRLRVHQGDFLDPFLREIFDPLERKFLAVEGKERTNVAVGPGGLDRVRFRFQQMNGEERGETVEIRLLVGQQ